MPVQATAGNGPRPFCVSTWDAPNSDVYDAVVRLLRPREDAPRLEEARVRGDLPRRRSRVPADAARPDGWLDGAADPHRRQGDRRLHGVVAARPRRRARRAARRLTRRAEPGSAAGDARVRDRRPATVAGLAAAAVDLELVLHRAGAAVGQLVVPE